jgi:ankyrin repeat protein
VTVDLAKHDVRVAYWGVREDRGWALKTGTAVGTVSIGAASDGGVSATYDVTLTAISLSDRGNVERQVTFQGTQVCTPYPGAGSRDMVGDAVQDAHTQDTIHRAADRGDRGAVEKFLAAGVDVNIKGDTIYEAAWTPLHHAAFHGQKSVAQVLLERGADVSAKTQAGRTALHEAAWRGNTDLAQLLIAKGADVNARSNPGLTPLDLAIEAPSRKARTPVARLLRKHGGKTSQELDGVKPSRPPTVRINH